MKKLKKQKTAADAAVHPKPSIFDEHQIREFLHRYGSTILYAGLGLAFAIAIFFQLTRTTEAGSLKDYIRADYTYSQFVKAPADESAAALEPLQKLMDRHPDLRQKYEGKVAQTLIGKDQVSAAQIYIDDSLTRLEKENLPVYHDYTETTLLIASGNYEDAYEHASALHSRLADMFETPENEAIYAFNYLRLASLQQQLGLKAEEQSSWKQILAYGEGDNAFGQMLSHIREGRLTLKSYINNRLAQ